MATKMAVPRHSVDGTCISARSQILWPDRVEQLSQPGAALHQLLLFQLILGAHISACKGGSWRGDVVQALMARLANGLSPLSYVRRTNHLSKLRLIIKEIQASGIHSANGIGRELNARGIRGLLGGRWGANQVRQVLMRLTEGLNRTEFMSTQAAAAVTWVSMLKPIVARIQAR